MLETCLFPPRGVVVHGRQRHTLSQMAGTPNPSFSPAQETCVEAVPVPGEDGLGGPGGDAGQGD